MARKKNYRGRGRGKKEKKVFPQVTGRVQMTREGYAFIIIEGEDDDVFVKASKTRGALHGDTVRVAVTREKLDKQRREGEVVEIIERSDISKTQWQGEGKLYICDGLYGYLSEF